MLFSSPIFRPVVSVSNNHERGQDEGGGGVLPYISHIGMYCPKGRVFGPFWSENTLPILVWNRVWVLRNYGSVHEWTYISFQFQMNKDEIEICQFEMHLENFFSLLSNLVIIT